ncbi:unnamed protein product [Calypogeia fissa]
MEEVMEDVDDSSLSSGRFPELSEFALPEGFPIYVAILVVACTLLWTGLLFVRRRRLTLAKARRHFVKGASFLAEAQRKGMSPTQAKVLAEQAIVEADLAIGIDPNDAAHHIVKSLALEVVGKSGAAIKELATALSRPKSLSIPERSSTLVKKAALESESGMIQEALQDLEESVSLTPKNPRLQILLGEAYEKDGNVDKAIQAFNQAVLLDPKSPDAKQALQRLQG